MENSSPNPSFSICDIRIQKQISRSFGKSIPQKKVLPKLRPHCSATCPNIFTDRTPKEKHPFLFQKKFHPRQIKKARSVFLSGLPRLCEAVAERYERTRQFQATTRSARAISRHRGCFQNTFELCTMNTARIPNPKGGNKPAPTARDFFP